MNNGPVAAISMHQYAKMPWRGLFADAEAIFRESWRPAALGQARIRSRGPMWTCSIRWPNAIARCGARPIRAGKFLNQHMTELFS